MWNNRALEQAQRIARLQTRLEALGLAGALMVYAVDVYYFSGTRQNALLWVPSLGEPTLLVRKSMSRALADTPLADVRPFKSSKDLPALLGSAGGKIGLTFDVLPVQQFNFYKKILPAKEFVDISQVVKEVRSVKSASEITIMGDAGHRLGEVFTQVPEFFRAGLREIDLAAEMECRSRKAGLEGYVRMRSFNQELFYGLVLAGANGGCPSYFDGPAGGNGMSSAFPYGTSTSTITPNVPILIDYTGVLNGYTVDMTRTFVYGQLDSQLAAAFAVALDIQDYLSKNLKPGAICSQLYETAVAMAAAAGLGGNFMGLAGEQVKFVGHGVGLELDELPILAKGAATPLAAGQTIAIEPKFVFPRKGVIGIENTFVVDEQGGIKLTPLDDAIVYLK